MRQSASSYGHAILALCLLAGAGCIFDAERGSGPDPADTFDVSLVNNSSQFIHILARDEKRELANRIAPNGGARSVVVISAPGEKNEFRAERDPEGLKATVTCLHTDPELNPLSNEAKVVVYTEQNNQGGLACANW